MKRIVHTALLALLFLSACKVSKDIVVQEPPLPVSFRNADTKDTSGIADIQWKQFFTNEGLQHLIDSAIVHNYDMQTAMKNIESAQWIIRQSRLGYLPEVTIRATGAISRPSDNSLNGLSLSQFLGQSYVEDYSVSTRLSWEADIWGKVRNQKAKALAEYLQTVEARRAVQTNLVSMIAKGYFNLLMLGEQVAIANKNLLLNDSTLTIIKLQYDAGQVTALAVRQAEAQRLVASQLIPEIEQLMAVQENALSILTGALPGSVKREGSINDFAFNDTLSAGLPSALLQNRPDVKAREQALTIANANTGITKANMYPSFAITAEGGINSFKASNWFNIPASLFATVAGGIVQPVFQRKQLKTQYELSKLEREKTVIAFRQTVLVAVGEVSDALVSVDKLKDQQSIASVRVDKLQQAINSADLLFKNGMANYLEVLTAQSNVLQGELELVNLKKEQMNAVVELYRSLGGGWK